MVTRYLETTILAIEARKSNQTRLQVERTIVEAFVQRAMGSDVRTVVVGGKPVMEDRRLLGLDVEALFEAVRDYCARGLPPEHKARADLLARIKPYAQAWYRGWHEGMVDAPFYRVNSAR